jgi:hypothetical protein
MKQPRLEADKCETTLFGAGAFITFSWLMCTTTAPSPATPLSFWMGALAADERRGDEHRSAVTEVASLTAGARSNDPLCGFFATRPARSHTRRAASESAIPDVACAYREAMMRAARLEHPGPSRHRGRTLRLVSNKRVAMKDAPCSEDRERAAIVESVAHEVTRAHAACSVLQARAIEEVATIAHATLQSRGAALLAELDRSLHAHERAGVPFPVLRAMGFDELERPYTRLLGWLLGPGSDHGAAPHALLAIARRLEFDVLASDLDAQRPVEVRVDRCWPPNADSAKRPDLLVLTPHAVLLIENKLYAGPSGEEQYPSYREALLRLASASSIPSENARAYLLAPDERVVPDGWTGSFTFSELAAWLVIVSESRGMARWDRALCCLVAEAFARDASASDQVRRARALRTTLDERHFDASAVAEIAALLPLPSPFDWEAHDGHVE